MRSHFRSLLIAAPIVIGSTLLAGCNIPIAPITAEGGIKRDGDVVSLDSTKVPVLEACEAGRLLRRKGDGVGWECTSPTSLPGVALITDVAPDSVKLGGQSAELYALKTEVAAVSTTLQVEVGQLKEQIAALQVPPAFARVERRTTSFTAPPNVRSQIPYNYTDSDDGATLTPQRTFRIRTAGLYQISQMSRWTPGAAWDVGNQLDVTVNVGGTPKATVGFAQMASAGRYDFAVSGSTTLKLNAGDEISFGVFVTGPSIESGASEQFWAAIVELR